MRPSPGWRRQQTPRVQQAPTARSAPAGPDFDPGFKPGSGLLTNGALPLLMVASKLRVVAYHNAIEELQGQLDSQIRDFQNRALQNGFSEQEVKTASYFICSFLDETVLNTPWGGQSNWGHDSLLVRFHKEALGGQEFFQTVERLLQRPAQNLDLLELAYMCLSLGFEGRYRFGKDGLRELEQLRTEIFLAIQRHRDTEETGLSVNWKGMRDLRSPFSRRVPLWVVLVLAALLLLALFIWFSYTLSRASNNIYNQWMAITNEQKVVPEERVAPGMPPAPVVQEQPIPATTRSKDWRIILATEINQKLVQVLDGPILRISSAFPSGSDRIDTKYLDLLNRIAGELKEDTSRVEVTGHTDNQSIFSVRFPSNWDLSKARAKAVAAQLDLDASGSLKERISSNGRSDTEPVLPNDTPEHRAMNRRVDIHIR